MQAGPNVIKETIKTLSNDPGVYRMIDRHDTVLYVGKAKCLPKRLSAYTKPEKLPLRLQRMVAATVRMEIVVTKTEVEALLLENHLIKKFKPRYNILLKDDKSYPYILLTGDTYPRIQKHRGAKDPQHQYFGPFANTFAVDEAILNIQRIFKIRNCQDSVFNTRKRPCLQYHIKRCTGPCVQKITPLEYQQNVQGAVDFLKGKTTVVQQTIGAKMEEASQNMEYEKAAIYRDQLKLISSIQSKQLIDVSVINNADVIGLYRTQSHCVIQICFFRYGKNFGSQSLYLSQTHNDHDDMAAFLSQFYIDHEPPEQILLSHSPTDFPDIQSALSSHYQRSIKWEIPKIGVKKELIDHAIHSGKAALEQKLARAENMEKIFIQMKDLFDLSDIPQRIEIFDNSHIQGSFPVGVMVVATPDGFDKKSYRKYNIKETRDFGGDDFAMMREVMTRRFSKTDTRPDLLLIDGGIGQVNAVLKILQDLDLSIPIVGIAKGKDRNAGREHFIIPNKDPFQLPFQSPLLYFLQKLRDESHRFAITTHRQRRIKNISVSRLDDVDGVGAKRKKALLLHFGSVQFVKEATLEDLMRVDGISESVAQKIYNYFRS
ncbi:MAG: UvrABC system protein C [Holosporales bacterium]